MNFGDKDDRIPWEEPRARPWEEWCRKCLGVGGKKRFSDVSLEVNPWARFVCEDMIPSARCKNRVHVMREGNRAVSCDPGSESRLSCLLGSRNGSMDRKQTYPKIYL